MYDREEVNLNAEYDDATDESLNENGKKVSMELFDWLSCFVIVYVCVMLVFVFVGRTIGVEGRSMQQTLQHNDRVIMSNLLYTPGNGDIIVFQPTDEKFENTPLVKRVIAVEGQTIDIDFETGYVFVDGNLFNEPYINNNTTHRHDFHGPLHIPRGYVFVMGDNRESSTDSRDAIVGLIDTRHILGRVHFILFPGIDDFGHRDWSRLGLIR